MEIYLILMLILMILGSFYSLNAKSLLSAVVSYGIIGFGLVICFLLLRAPDLAIVQVVVEIFTLVIMIAVIKDTFSEDKEAARLKNSFYYLFAAAAFAFVVLMVFFSVSGSLTGLGDHFTRMAGPYIDGAKDTGSANLVTGIVFDFRAYDTLGEATVLFTAVVGVLSVMRLKGKKSE